MEPLPLHPQEEVASLADHDLLRWLRTDPHGPAWEALSERYAPLVRCWLACLAARAGLPAADVEDALQEVLAFTLPHAAEVFPLPEAGPAPPDEFARYLHAGVRNLIRLRARRRQAGPRCRCWSELGDRQGAALLRAGRTLPGRRSEDPSRPVEVAEVCRCVRDVLRQLPELDRRVCAGVAAGESLSGIARRLAVPREQIKSRWRRLRTHFPERLRALLGGTPL
jgi:DNA-directed RNA polymerase specialized sigma24 family protein